MSVVIVMAAAGGSGKSTTSRMFAMGEPQVFQSMELITLQSGLEEERKCTWTLYDNCGLTGGPRGGTDDNVSPQLVRIALYKALEHSDVAIIDGYMASPRWIEAINDHPDVTGVVVVHFQLSHGELLRRIAQRLGVQVDDLPEKRVQRAIDNQKRPERLLRQFDNTCTKEFWIIDVYDEDSPDDIVDMIDEAICDIFQDCEE